MLNRAARSPGNPKRRQWPTLSIVVAGAALFIALGGSAVAAKGLIHAGNIARGAVTSKAIKDGKVKLKDLSTSAQDSLRGAAGVTGSPGSTGAPGAPGANGANGPNGANGADGRRGARGDAGADGADGADGTNGTNGINGTNGTNGTNGIIAPLSATVPEATALLTGAPLTEVVSLTVPAGNYVVLAKTQLSHTGAGDTVDCVLKAGTTSIDQVAMKTLPALAAIPVSLQAVTTTSPTHLGLECKVLTAGGSAAFSSLIAIPTG